MRQQPLRSCRCSNVALRLRLRLVQQGQGAAQPDYLFLAMGLFKVSCMLQERERLAKAAKAAEGSSEEGEQAEAPAGLCHRLHGSACSVCLPQSTCRVALYCALESGCQLHFVPEACRRRAVGQLGHELQPAMGRTLLHHGIMAGLSAQHQLNLPWSNAAPCIPQHT